jgi:hypothetical protein
VLLVAVPVGDQLEQALDLDSAVYGAYRVEVDVKARAPRSAVAGGSLALRVSVQTFQTVTSVSAPVASPQARIRSFRYR